VQTKRWRRSSTAGSRKRCRSATFTVPVRSVGVSGTSSCRA